MDIGYLIIDVNEIQIIKIKNGEHAKDENLKNRRLILVFVYENQGKYQWHKIGKIEYIAWARWRVEYSIAEYNKR